MDSIVTVLTCGQHENIIYCACTGLHTQEYINHA